MAIFLKRFWPFLLLAILAFSIHLAFLSHPAQVVFDEVHFGKFVAAYFTHEYYFDIHPPLGKLMIAGFVKLAGVNPIFAFEKIGENLPANVLLAMRFLPAFFGGLLILAFAWLAYLVSRSRVAAIIAGFLILLDNAFLVQSRFILVDAFLLFFGILTFCFFFLWQHQKSFSGRWFGYLILTAVFFGLTISVKWTGLATLGIIGVILGAKIFNQKLANYLSPSSYSLPDRPLDANKETFADQWKKYFLKLKIKEFLIGSIFLFIVGFAVYALPFAVHFKLLPLPGPGSAFMSAQFQNELKYGPISYARPLTFIQKTTELNQVMLKANAGITANHPFGSKWYSWPFGRKPVYYWNEEATGLPSARIYFLGNPLIWFLAFAVMIFTFWKIFSKKDRQKLTPIFYILPLAYLANLLPFIFIKRVAFLYHYLPAVSFAILLLSLWLAKLWSKERSFLIIFFCLAALVFLSLAPFSYGWALPAIFEKYQPLFFSFFS